MKQRFSVTLETTRGESAAANWLEVNPGNPGIPVLAEKSFLPFEECDPQIIAKALDLSPANFKKWWKAYSGSEQDPSHSFVQGFLREIARLRYTPPLASVRERLSARGFAEDDDGEPAK
jgi:hypothetical protein